VIIIKVTNYWKVEAVQPVTYGGNDNGLPNPCPYFVEFVHERLGHRIQMPLDASTRQTVSAYLALLEMFEDGLSRIFGNDRLSAAGRPRRSACRRHGNAVRDVANYKRPLLFVGAGEALVASIESKEAYQHDAG
jgi:hypothetical protein